MSGGDGVIEVFEQDAKTNIVQSSKGNQLKWKNEDTWYKADYLGYEGLAEYLVSALLEKSTLDKSEYVIYDLEKIKYKKTIYNGCKSENFLEDGWQIITLERLFKSFFDESLNKCIYQITDNGERLHFLVNQVERITGLTKFGIYMNKLFTIDALFLNEDRHTHNIAVLMNQKGDFDYCPIFDQGAGLLSDTKMDYPLGGELYELIDSCKPKTICQDFQEQLEVSEQLFGCNLKFFFTGKDVKVLLDKADHYTERERNRVEELLHEQMRKYPYLFMEVLKS
ncbi:MAG: hypothetical protein PHE02_01270 [Lachnospiraceae bacterium]|nr:hypothetical protein [Lachnospiraceae bacterium]